MLICSWVIMKRVWINNVCSVLADATHYHARPLVRLLQEYLAINMEVFLESRMLEDLAAEHIKQLSAYIRTEQARKYPVSRSTRIVDKAMETWGAWLALQDFPQPIVPTVRASAFRDSPKLSPPGPSKRSARQSSVPSSPMLRPTFSARPVATGIPDDEVFLMDEPEAAPQAPPTPTRVPGGESPAKPPSGWKPITSAPRVDMKAIMAEASTKVGAARPPASRGFASGLEAIARGPPPTRGPVDGATKAAPLPRAPSGGQSWRTPPQGATPVSGTPAAPSVPLPSAAKEVRPQPSGSNPTPAVAPVAGPSGAPRSQPGTPRKPVAPGLGPVFTPTKQASTSSGASSIRRVSYVQIYYSLYRSLLTSMCRSGSVWTPPPVQPVQPVVRATSSGSAISFAAIQLSQLEQDVAPAKDRRTLVEIQEEERARQVEEDFLRWWTAEEARLKEEQAAVAALVSGTPSPQRPRKSRAPRGKPPAAGGTEAQKGGGKAKNAEGTKQQRAKPTERSRREGGQEGVAQGQEQGQGGKPRRRRPAPGREEERKPQAQS